jgi:hypothetical protein
LEDEPKKKYCKCGTVISRYSRSKECHACLIKKGREFNIRGWDFENGGGGPEIRPKPSSDK